MLLKSLELNGFKSFPDKTVLTFEKGATVVVGPNGSGKSNISDAMRWVLGEISSRNIRGTKMEDVIFGGTDQRRQMSYAEVSVTFDNTDGDSSVDLPYDEVTVTRKYFRSGDSEYYINRKPVRLKDIHELFMNTGVGRTGYSIIGQGRISEIISLKSEERRGIFEEAAGIAKYKYKKNEAEKKLNGVSENLTRVNDLLSELSSRVGPLEKEAEKARKYLEYYEIKKRADISLWVYDIERLNSEIEKAQENYIITRNELDALEETIASLEAQDERASNQAQDNRLEYEKINGEISAATKRMYDLDRLSKISEKDILHRKDLKLRYEAEIERQKARLEIANEAISQASALLLELEAKLNESNAGLAKKREESESTSANMDRLSSQIDLLLEKIRENEQSVQDKKLRLSALESARQSQSEQKSSLDESISEYSESLALIESRIKQADTKIASYNEKAGEISRELEKTDAELAKYDESLEKLNSESNEIYIELASKEHRVTTLKRMEELLEGYSHSVRFVMSEYEKGDIENAGTVYGPLSKLISVEEKYSLAIETALGANLQNIVVDNESTAKAAIRHLKNKNAGRATFYPISSMKERTSPVSEKDAKGYRGFLALAENVPGYDSKFAPVIKSLLGSTMLFDNIDNATTFAKATGYKVRVVTLDGQIINAGGSFTGGSAKKESGILTRTSETGRLENEIEALKKRQGEIKEKIAQITASAEKLKNETASQRNNLAIIESLRNAENTQLEVLKSQAESDKRMLDELKGDITRLGEDDSRNINEYDTLKRECEELLAENAQIAEKRFELDGTRYELENENEKRAEEISALNIVIAEISRDIENAKIKLEEKRADASEIDESIKTAFAEIESLEGNNESDADSIESGKREILEIEEQIKLLEEKLAKNVEDGQAIERRRNDLRVKIRDNNDRKENVVRSNTNLENRCKNLNSELDKMTARLWDEYELTYSTALECGYERVTADTRSDIAAQQTEYRNKLRALGNVNVNAVEEYADVKQRYDFMSVQVADLEKSKQELLEIITKLEGEMCETFVKAFENINQNFKVVFKELFGGGEAELSLNDPDNVLTSGIEIRVAPPGKIIKSLMLLSGGEQSFVAIALIFAILRVNPTPFCIFDEIEAALDEANVFRFADYIKRYSDKNQFIVITHRRPTMEIADKLYGVTMYEKGISKILTLELGEIEEKVGIKS
ncbi:MAG: chromosome segregation protein SMC [Clostridia bacterium]|nr:chromosome segregation protein SMC [Clostridia bacterium]